MRPLLSHPKYRPDIDGLRAIAVLGVVAFHTFPGWMHGGFIGVDVFFVISGYLISTIIFENLEKGTFSFFDFYSRRVRRIFPSLLVVMISVYVLGWFTLLADEYKQLGRHIAGGSIFASNFVLWQESGYFDNVAETKPLLHLWSLGIEEQYYIFFPAMMWVAWKKRVNLFGVTVALLVVSLYLSVSWTDKKMVTAFYSPLSRFWELMCGSVLAWTTIHKRGYLPRLISRSNSWLQTALRREPERADGDVLGDGAALLGGLLLGYGLFQIDKGTKFPGWWALVPVASAVLIISAGPRSWINRAILSNRVLIWFGVISFPLYLWHWILLSLPRVIDGRSPGSATKVVIVLCSVLLSWLTYRFIERPLRSSAQEKRTTLALVSAMIVIGLIGYVTHLEEGLDFRADARIESSRAGDIGHLDYHRYIAEKYFLCTPDDIAKDALKYDKYVRCMQSKAGEGVDVALIGDSHAEHLFIGVADALPMKNVAFYIRDGAPFLSNPDFDKIYKMVADSKSIDVVIVTMYWEARRADVALGSTLVAEMVEVVDLLTAAGKVVYLADNVPSFPFDPGNCKGARRFSSSGSCTISYRSARAQERVYIGWLREVVRQRPLVRLVSVGKTLCNEEDCRMINDNVVLYRDRIHLNISGSALVGRRLVEENPSLSR